jgi:RNA polymerase sigma-70 factor, ECF subfamily
MMMHIKNRDRKETNDADGKKNHQTVAVLEDLKLAQSAKSNREAAVMIVERLAPRIRRSVIMAVGNDQDVDDLTNGCLLEVLENLSKFKGTGSLEAWAGRLSYRVMMRSLSRRRRNERTVTVVPDELGVASSDPEKESAREHLRDRLIFHLKKLPEERRMTLVMRLVYHYSVAEVAEIMDTPINTVRDRIRVGLKELRQHILKDPKTADFLSEKQNE